MWGWPHKKPPHKMRHSPWVLRTTRFSPKLAKRTSRSPSPSTSPNTTLFMKMVTNQIDLDELIQLMEQAALAEADAAGVNQIDEDDPDYANNRRCACAPAHTCEGGRVHWLM